MRRRAVHVRLEEDATRTLGYLMVLDDHIEVGRFAILELPWKENRRNISRIPAGSYLLKPDYSPRLGYCLRLFGVPGRSDILVHAGNYPAQTRGCLLAGIRFVDLDGDGRFDAGQSRAAMDKLKALVPEEGLMLKVIEAFKEGGE